MSALLSLTPTSMFDLLESALAPLDGKPGLFTSPSSTSIFPIASGVGFVAVLALSGLSIDPESNSLKTHLLGERGLNSGAFAFILPFASGCGVVPLAIALDPSAAPEALFCIYILARLARLS